MDDRRRAFTLTEMLVVLGIVAVLASILVPVYASARHAAARSTCLSNVRNLGAAMLLYLGDHDDRFPDSATANPGGEWGHLLLTYARSHAVYRCPTDPTQPPSDWKYGGDPTDVMSYGLNNNLPSAYFRLPRSTAMVRRDPLALTSPSRTVMFFEVEDSVIDLERTHKFRSDDHTPLYDDSPTGNTASNPILRTVPGGEEAEDWPNGASYLGPSRPIRYATGAVGERLLNEGKGSTPRHSGTSNYLACDGHARALRPEAVSGGADAEDEACDQGTVTGQTGACAAQRKVSAAGTGHNRYAMTFSAR